MMLLRRVSEHVKAQNWFAVALDFVIVVFGVFVGIQVANVNEARIERAQLSQQLESLRIEMQSNLQRIAAHASWCDSQLETASALRQMLSGDLSEVNPQDFDARLLDVQNIRTFVPELTAYEELAQSGGIRRIAGTPLRDALARWQEELAAVQRIDRDALIHRDEIRTAYLSSSLSMGALLEHYSRAAGKIAPSRFHNDLHVLADDVRLDNFLAMRAAISAGIPTYLEDLAEQTRDIIALLDNDEIAK